MGVLGGVIWWAVLGALVGWVAAWWLGRSTQRLLTEPVIQIVERVLDNPRHVSRIATLESELSALQERVATIPSLQARLDEALAAPPKIVEKVVEKLITRTVDRTIEKPVEKIVERVVPDLAAIAERDAALRARRQRVEHLEALAAVLAQRVAVAGRPDAPAPGVAPERAPAPPPTDDPIRPLRARIEHLEALAAVQAERLAETRGSARAGAAGFAVSGEADIEIVEGIGPTIAELLRARGFGSFGALAQASPGTLREILDDNGPAYRVADPSTWPEQARLAADGRWDELKTLQAALHAGRR